MFELPEDSKAASKMLKQKLKEIVPELNWDGPEDPYLSFEFYGNKRHIWPFAFPIIYFEYNRQKGNSAIAVYDQRYVELAERLKGSIKSGEFGRLPIPEITRMYA